MKRITCVFSVGTYATRLEAAGNQKKENQLMAASYTPNIGPMTEEFFWKNNGKVQMKQLEKKPHENAKTTSLYIKMAVASSGKKQCPQQILVWVEYIFKNWKEVTKYTIFQKN